MSMQNTWAFQINGQTAGYFYSDFVTTFQINPIAQNNSNCSELLYVGMPKTQFFMYDVKMFNF